MDHGSAQFITSLNRIATRKATPKALSQFKIPDSLKQGSILHHPMVLSRPEQELLKKNRLPLTEFSIWIPEKRRAIQLLNGMDTRSGTLPVVVSKRLLSTNILLDMGAYLDLMGVKVLVSLGCTSETLKMIQTRCVFVSTPGNAGQDNVTVIKD